MPRVLNWSPVPKPVIGMLHLQPLPGSPRYSGDSVAALDAVLWDAAALVGEGVHALLLENYGDAPFYPRRVPRETVACLTQLAAEVRRRFEVPLGINVLRNDGRSALAIAYAVGAVFIRVNVLCGARLTDQGIVEGIAHRLLRDRTRWGTTDIAIWADVNVKHSTALAERRLEDEVAEMIDRGGADAIIVSGATTGDEADFEEIQRIRAAVDDRPVLVGSGVRPDNLAHLAPYADGFIVGTFCKHAGITTNPVDPDRVRHLMSRHSQL